MLIKIPTPGKLYFLRDKHVWYLDNDDIHIKNQEACLVLSVEVTGSSCKVTCLLPSLGLITRSSYHKFHYWSDWWSEEP